MKSETLHIVKNGGVIFAEIAAPPMNLLGPELVRDLVALIKSAEADPSAKVLVFKSADPDYFISHVDVTRMKDLRAETSKLISEGSLALLLHHLSRSRLVTIAQIAGRVRGVGSEFALACDMRFAAIESAIFGQFEAAFGVIPGAGGAQHLVRLMGRSRALEVMLGGDDYDAGLAERYGWINRALPTSEIDAFVESLAQRIARIPDSGRAVVKERVNSVALPSADDVQRDSTLFVEGLGDPQAQSRLREALQKGMQDRTAELTLPSLLNGLEG